MVKRLLLLSLAAFALGAQAQYQMANSDFEDWKASSGEPDHWHGFKSAKGSLAGWAKGTLAKSTDKRPGSTGNYSAVITAGFYFVVNNGSMTTGQLQAGNMSAANTANHAEMDKTSTATDKNGDKFYMPFTGRPDAMKVWLKFTQATPQTTYKYASVSAVITDGSFYQDPEDKAYSNKMAQAKNAQIATCDWTEFTVPFEYLNNSVEPEAILCTFGTNATPGQGSDGDQVFIDDIEMVYYSELSAAQYNGADVTFTDGAATIDAEYNASLLNLTKKGVGGTIETSIDADGLLTITVKGDNISEDEDNYHTYTIQFNASAPEPAVVSTKTFTEDLYVTLGTSTNDKQVAGVTVETLENGNINFVLKNFVLNGMPVGNIAVKNIEVAEDNSFSFNGGIQIAEGDDPTVEMWLGPVITEQCGGSVPLDMTGRFIGDDHVVVYIAIDIAEFVGYPVEVHLGYARATMAVNATAKYGTFCAPFAVEIPTGVTASKVTSVDANGLLTLTDLSTTIPANTPVVLFAESGLETVELFGVAEAGTPTAGLLTGVYEATKITSGYVLQNLDNKVAFYQVSAEDPITVPANRCYLTAPAGSVKALAFPDGTLTSISEIQAADEKAVIYDLSGRRVSKATKGIYIINGKKVIK
ncbi:MAG: PCMD domain-containing protein [Bacteroidaceae bacterium]|nr:PCMD domain-containing protein [Bacteroidaceae bacterium]